MKSSLDENEEQELFKAALATATHAGRAPAVGKGLMHAEPVDPAELEGQIIGFKFLVRCVARNIEALRGDDEAAEDIVRQAMQVHMPIINSSVA